MSERVSRNDHLDEHRPDSNEAKIYYWPKQSSETEDDADDLPTPETIASDLDKVAFVYSRWLHPSLTSQQLPEIIAAQRFDGIEAPFSQAWDATIEDLAKRSSLFNDYEELISDPALAKLEELAKSLSISDKDERAIKQAVMVLMDLRAYGAKAGLSDRTLEVCQKLLNTITDDD